MYPLAGHLSSFATEIVQNILASFLGTGSLSAFRLATRIVDAFAGLLANSILTAVMPTLSHDLAMSNHGGMKRRLAEALRLLMLLCLPATAWLLFTKKVFIALLFERMRFSASDTELVCLLLGLSLPYIFLSRLFGLAELGFYAGCDTRTPLAGQLTVTITYIGAMLALFSSCKVFAFPVARSISYIASSLLMAYLFHRRFGGVWNRGLTIDAFKIALATSGMVAMIGIAQYIVSLVPLSGLTMKLVSLLVPTFIGVGSFIVFSSLLAIEEVRELFLVFGLFRRIPDRAI
jgi:putative peptidoglycan lipid II flippase